MKYTYKQYFAFLDEARDRGYTFGGFDADPPERGALLLRHDVDLDLAAAVTFAELEQAHGVTSTYFVLLTSPCFNPASASGFAAVRRLVECGHRVGLHHDATLIPPTRDPGAAIAGECEDLARIAGQPVGAVSFHRPSPDLFGASRLLTAPRRHTYEPSFVTGIDYCSDSTGEWRYGPPTEREAYVEGRSMQFLTHPEMWDEKAVSLPWRRAVVAERLARSTRRAAAAELDV